MIAVTVGYQQPSSPWLTELHLTDCELPCWHGIVPGQTAFPDARKQVEGTYDDAVNYLVEEIIDEPGVFWLRVINRVTGYGLVVGVITGSPGTSEQEPVQAIIVSPVVEERSNFRRALIPDLYSILGDVEAIAIPQSGGGFLAALFYKDNQVVVSIPLLPCQKVRLGQEITQLNLSNSSFLEDTGWMSEGFLQWRGFGLCYGI